MIDEELVQAVRSHEAVLFVGAGVSRSLGLPSFSELIGELAVDLGYDPEVFEQLGGYSTLAEYYYLEQHGFGDLRSRLDARWHDSSIDIAASRIHRLIVELEFPVIYTTNWDRWLELAHEGRGRSVHRIVGVGDLRDIPSGATQIVKYHGDFSDDESLVLTESSYMRRMDFSSPLDIKLRSDTLGKSLLFVGYSLQDPNTRLLLFKLHQLWVNTAYADAQPSSFLITDHPNPVQKRVLKEWGVTSLVGERGDTWEEGMVTILAELAQIAMGKSGLIDN